MPLTLEKYAESLDQRSDLIWPAPPEPVRTKAKPHLKKLPGIKAVAWNVYGTLLNISQGELLFEHPTRFVMDVALDKTVQEFKMWKSMTRKPGAPADVLIVWYRNVLDELRFCTPAGEKHPEIHADKLWANIVKKLMTNEYTYLVSQYGSLEEYGEKIAYFFHASLQGTAAYPEAARTVQAVNEQLGKQALIADGQCFTWVQLKRGLAAQEPAIPYDLIFPSAARVFSRDVNSKKPSEKLYREGLAALTRQGLEAEEILYVGNDLHRDIVPAKRLGMKTALFAGDRNSAKATTAELNQKDLRPNVLLTELGQVLECLA